MPNFSSWIAARSRRCLASIAWSLQFHCGMKLLRVMGRGLCLGEIVRRWNRGRCDAQHCSFRLQHPHYKAWIQSRMPRKRRPPGCRTFLTTRCTDPSTHTVSDDRAFLDSLNAITLTARSLFAFLFINYHQEFFWRRLWNILRYTTYPLYRILVHPFLQWITWIPIWS